jgi:hypothetical protein
VSGLLAAAFDVLVSLHLSLAIAFGRVLSTAVWPEKDLRNCVLVCCSATKKLAGLNRDFRFTQQKHICAAAKKETPHGRRNRNIKTQPKEKSMKHNLNRFAAILLFACVAITCSLTMWATTPGHDAAADTGKTSSTGAPFIIEDNQPAGNFSACVGDTRVFIPEPFAAAYSCVKLGPVPGVPVGWGALTLKYDDPNTLLMGGHANTANGRIYQIGITRDADMHITGFTGTATVYPTADSTIGENNDGGLVFGPENVLFVTRFPNNQLEQSKPGSTDPDKVTDLTPLGIGSSVGSIGFVPSGFPGAGNMKIVSASGEWYQCDFVPDGNGTFEVISVFPRVTLADTPEGIVFVPPGSPIFPANSVLINNWSTGKIVTAPLDTNGDPIIANTQTVVEGFGASEGPFIDPVTGDLLFWSTNNGGVIFRVRGFEVPPTPGPTPTPTPGPCQYRVLVAYADTEPPILLPNEILAEPGVATVDLFDAFNATPTLQQLQQYDIVFAFSRNPWNNPAAMGDVLADYEDAGGVVVVGNFAWDNQSTWNLSGRWVTGGYSPFNSTSQQLISYNTANITNPPHQLMQGVSGIRAYYRNGVTLTAGAIPVATWTDGPAAVAYKTNNGRTAVGINACLNFQNFFAGAWGRVIVNAGKWLLPCNGTPTPTPTATPTATATATATPTATATATPSATATPTGSPTSTPTPSATPSPTASPTPSTTPTSSPTPTSGGCVVGQGYWRNHEQWPLDQLQLGNRTYNSQELQSILRQPSRGNALVQLAQQEIAAKLNIAAGAEGSCVAQVLAAADASIGNLVVPPVGNGYLPLTSYVRTLGTYNNGNLCAPKCDLPWTPGPGPRPTARPHPTRAPRP